MPYCVKCGNKAHSEYCFRHKPRKPIRQRGKAYMAWTTYRENVAKPYLDRTVGHTCACCGRGDRHLDVDHIINKGSRPDLKYDLNNMQYLCRPCHRAKTDRQVCNHGGSI